MKNENFYVIQGWMINSLKLKGNELLVYAVINGFSQDGQGAYHGSLKYLQEATNGSKPTVMKSLSLLVEKGLLKQYSEIRNKVKYNTYQCSNFTGGKETLPGGGKETLPGGGKETLPNNILSNNKKNNNKAPDVYSEDFLQFWNEYPRKKDKRAAFKSWFKEKPDINYVLYSLRLWKNSHTFPTEERYIKLPVTWINNRCWEDYDYNTDNSNNSDRKALANALAAEQMGDDWREEYEKALPVGLYDR